MRRNKRSEEGATMVMMGISLVALLFMVSLVIDGGRAFSARRSAQNATDAAALAGSQALFSYQYAVFNNVSPAPSASAVNAAVVAKLTQNSAAVDQSCEYVTASGAGTGVACSSGSIPTTAQGVRVGGGITQNAAFKPVVGSKIFTAKGASTATVQPLKGTSAPFIVCGVSSGDWPILDPVIQGRPITINVANAVAAGIQPLQAAKVGTCGAGSAFKGKADSDQEITLDPNDGSCTYPCGYADADNGNGYDAEIRDSVAGTVPCPDGTGSTATLDCDMLLPIADSGFGNGSSIKMHVVAWGIFHVTGDGHGNPKYYGQFVAPGKIATGGVGGQGQQCNVGSNVCVIKLVA
jgi:Flp pilus assembly protein TadG